MYCWCVLILLQGRLNYLSQGIISFVGFVNIELGFELLGRLERSCCNGYDLCIQSILLDFFVFVRPYEITVCIQKEQLRGKLHMKENVRDQSRISATDVS